MGNPQSEKGGILLFNMKFRRAIFQYITTWLKLVILATLSPDDVNSFE
jgi:hypothetical protein